MESNSSEGDKKVDQDASVTNLVPFKVKYSSGRNGERKDYSRLPEALKRFYVVQCCDQARMTAVCTLCESTVKSNIGVTSNLHRHLKMRHLEEVQAYFSWSVIPETPSSPCKSQSSSQSCKEPKENVRLSSILRRYYNVIDKSNNRLTLSCKLCGILLKSNAGVTSNFHRHIKGKHSQDILTESGGLSLNTINFSTCDKTFPNFGVNNPRQDLCNRLLLEMVASDISLISCIETDAFKKFVSALSPNFHVSSRDDVIRKLQQAVQLEVLPTFRKSIYDIPDGCLHSTIDVWTSHLHHAIMCIRLQFITKEWEFVNNTIALLHSGEQQSAAKNIFAKFENVLSAFDLSISRVGYIAVGNARELLQACQLWQVEYDDAELASFMSEMDESSEENLDFESIAHDCLVDDETSSKLLNSVIHQLHLAVKDACRACPAASVLLATVSGVMKHFHKLRHVSEKMQRIAEQNLFVTTKSQWISQLDIIQNLCKEEVFEAISQISREVNNESNGCSPPPKLSSSHYSELVELLAILKPVIEASDSLQGSGITSSLVIPVVKGIFSVLNSLHCTKFASFKHILMMGISDRLKNILVGNAYVLAAVLDPRFKLQPFEGEIYAPGGLSAAEAEEKLLSEYAKHCHAISHCESQQETMAVSKSSTNDAVKKLGEKRIFSCLSASDRKKRKSVSEVDSYLQDESFAESKIDDPLTYWKVNYHRYPKLSLLARKYLSIPVTTASTQRIFSITKDICGTRRSRITPLELETVVLYRENCMQEQK